MDTVVILLLAALVLVWAVTRGSVEPLSGSGDDDSTDLFFLDT